MARFDIYPSDTGYNLDVQTDLVGELNTRLVVPLMPPKIAPIPHHRLNPTFDIDGRPHVMVTQYLSAVRLKLLGRPIGSLDDHYDRIRAALDMIFVGF